MYTIVGDQVCYNHIGCFQNTAPYTNSLGKLPNSPDHIRPSFTLHTRQNVNSTSQQLDPFRLSTITASNYDVHHKTAFIVHGFHGTKSDEWIQPLVKALLDEVWLVLYIVFTFYTRYTTGPTGWADTFFCPHSFFCIIFCPFYRTSGYLRWCFQIFLKYKYIWFTLC